MISQEEINKKIKSAFWDYNIDPENIYAIVLGKKEETKFFTSEKIIIRLLERLSWYEIVDILGKEFLTRNLTASIISKIKFRYPG